ncbi:hypothetical protein CYY_006905 [Polysphondylium violaceum]|uniref:DOCK family protein n=1 Tax=Polysphondylium violaceum TaxID=133409 RepID=A0A8J4V2P4_9MYCE|nr:hypothetical protein CYY_006905 [Polysphondylium violaceum]
MEGKKISTFIKSRKSTSGQSSHNLRDTPPNLPSSSSSASLISSASSNNLLDGNNNSTFKQQPGTEDYYKRNTRQIPSILLEDEIEKDDDYPFDFEKYYYESKEINREVSRELVVIPDDSVQNQIEKITKENRINTNPIDYIEKKNLHTDDCIQFYSSNSWKAIKSFNYTKDENPGTIVGTISEERMEFKTDPIINSNIPLGISTPASKQSELNNSGNGTGNNNAKEVNYLLQQHQYQQQNTIKTNDADELHLQYLERQLRKDKQQQPQQEKSMLSYFTLSEPPLSFPDPSVFQKEKKRIIEITAKDLSFKFWEKEEETEPLFVSMYLYDIQKKTRLSETFHFDFNNDKTLRLLGNHAKSGDQINLTKKAIFYVNSRSSADLDNIYLIVKIEKVLMGDLEDHSEPYIKMNLKEKEKDKFKDHIRSSASRLGAYRQPFCWGCIPVFEEGVGEDTVIRPLYRHRAEMTDTQLLDSTLSEGSKSASTKKLKVIPGSCTIDIREITKLPNREDATKHVYNSSLVPLSFNTTAAPAAGSESPGDVSLSSSLVSTPDPLSPILSSPPLSSQTSSQQTLPKLVHPGQVPSGVNTDNIYKECQEFITSSKFDINTEFVNNLYIYPELVNLSNRSGSVAARNITCKVQLMECDDNVNFDGIKSIYGKSRSEAFVTKAYTSVTYHSKSPTFNDEIKIRLPLTLSPNLNILFTFYHITCQKTDKENQFDAPVGHAVLPLMQNGKLLGDETFNLPVGYEFPPRYMKRETENLIRYIDNKKPIFQVRSKLVSSIYSTDDNLNQFFNCVSNFNLNSPASPVNNNNNNNNNNTTTAATTSPNTSNPDLSTLASPPTLIDNGNVTVAQMIKSIKQLPQCKIDCIIQFLPIIMNQLFRLMTSPAHSSELCMVTFTTIGEILAVVNDVSSNIFDRYAKYVFTNTPNSELPVYEVLIKTWLELMRFQEQNSENILRFSRFFFSLIYKSMALSLIERNKREENKTRRGRFVGIRPQLAKLVAILRWESAVRAKHTFKLAKELIRSLAMFISNLLSIADRGYVFRIVEKAVVDFDQNLSTIQQQPLPTQQNQQHQGENETELYELKFEFLRIICQNDYFVQLNIPLPFRVDTTLKLQQILSISKHFLSELLMNNIASGLSSKIALVRMDAANSLRDTLIRIEMDTRWQDVTNKQRIVGVFSNYLSIVINNWDNIKDDSFIMKRNILISFVYLLKHVHPNLIRMCWKEETKAKHLILFEILTVCSDLFEFVGKEILIEKVESSTSLRTSTAKSILEDFYSNSRGSPYGSKKLYNRSLREKRVDARKSILDSYNTVGGSGSGTGSGFVPSSSSTNVPGSPTVTSVNGSGGSSASGTPTGTGTISSSGSGIHSHYGTLRNEKRMKGTLAQNKINLSDYDDRLESHLSYEVGSVILDIADEFMYEYERDLKNSHSFDVLEKIFNILNSLLKKNQPVLLIPKLYATLRQFIFKFPKTIFENNNVFCLELCNAAIRHCNSVNHVTREEAAAFTYILFRKNFEQSRSTVKNFVRTKTQITIGLSTIVKTIKEDYYLKKSLDSINTYAAIQADKLGIKSFSKQIEDLTKRLHTFVIDNIKINNHRDDPEMVADLYHRIADNNKSNAETRICWLQGLADFHRTQENYVEAAECYLHMSALVSEYLTLIQKPIPTISGSSSFLSINKNSLEESHSYIEREEDGSDGQSFTIEFFMKLVQDAIGLLKEADHYEVANLVYKQILIPVHEHNLNYEELARSHGDLQDIFKRIVECYKTQSRMLGSYYRVGLYGKPFEEFSGKEFIYKEPKITRLVEIKDRLRTLYSKKLGVSEDSITIIEGSQIDVSTIVGQNQDKCYLQITSVNPYFGVDEVSSRRTVFDKNVNLNRFIFETPFTENGAGRGSSVADQYKRKTILTVSHYFPYTKKRIQVCSKQEIILSPIESSIETIDQRSEQIMNEVRAQTPNPKTLQQILQGTLRLQVNSGPQEICRIFLAEGSTYHPDHIKQLKKSLSIFLGSCSEALFIHKGLVENQSSQDFQEEMEQGYYQLTELMETFSVYPPEGSYNPIAMAIANANNNNNNSTGSNTPTINISSSLANNLGSKSHSRHSSRNSANGITLESSVGDDIDPSLLSTSLPSGGTGTRRSFTQRLSNSFKKGIDFGTNNSPSDLDRD